MGRTTAKVTELPNCDICKELGIDRPAKYDANVIPLRTWAFVCWQHFAAYDCKLGEGMGQRLILVHK